MWNWLWTAAIVAPGMLAPVTPAAMAQTSSGFVVVVNAANPVTEITSEDLSNLFLKRQIKWPTGIGVVPVDQDERAQVREPFSRQVHGRAPVAIRAYWQQQVFSGRDVPPVEKSSDAEVLRFVAETPGAIGYVRRGISLPADVKSVAISDR